MEKKAMSPSTPPSNPYQRCTLEASHLRTSLAHEKWATSEPQCFHL